MTLLVFQSMWGMNGLPWRSDSEWTLEQRVAMVADAGFDGMSLEIDDPALDRIVAMLDARGLAWCISAFPTTAEELPPAIEEAARLGAHHLNVQPNVRPYTVSDALPIMTAWQRQAEAAAIPVYFETHRDRLTTDLLFTLQVIDAIPEVRLTADLSHYLVGREFRWPVDDENHALIRRILDRSDAFHGRVASREQVQVSFQFEQNHHWLELFLGWWQYGFRRWQMDATPGARCAFVVELGPPEYAITGSDGHELSDRWLDALRMKELIRAVWDQAAAEEPAT